MAKQVSPPGSRPTKQLHGTLQQVDGSGVTQDGALELLEAV